MEVSRNEANYLRDGSWFYLNERSVDVVTKEPNERIVRLREADLRLMLANLKPKRKRKARGQGA